LITAPNLDFSWLVHGFGLRDSVPPPLLTTAKQIHSATVLDACGRRGEQIGEGDAIVSCEAGIAIGIRTADCVPILVADPENRMVACIHAGWRGTAANIAGATIDVMRSRGSKPENLHVAIGPSIGSCCYGVGPDVMLRFEIWRRKVESDDGPTLDLPAVNESQLREAGVQQIWKSGECTFCQPARFFSFRREKERAGRMLSFVSRVA
jgi:purine-nucleoside/S-methyl-5'-thioadenosine phosphorylase / adenosine deaminase